jgi:hypothetical protein
MKGFCGQAGAPNKEQAMADNTISISGNCPCGTRVSWDDESSDDTILVCKNCGANLGTYGDFKNKAMDTVREHVRDTFKNLFKSR